MDRAGPLLNRPTQRDHADHEPAPLDGTASLAELIPRLAERLTRRGFAEAIVEDPDRRPDAWAGEPDAHGVPHRDLRAWVDLAELLGARLATPRPGPRPGTLRLLFTAAGGEASFHAAKRPQAEPHAAPCTAPNATTTTPDGSPPHAGDARYAADADFARLRKHEHPAFLLPLAEAIAFAAGRDRPEPAWAPWPEDGPPPAPPARTLLLGCHRADELHALRFAIPDLDLATVTGVDRDRSALADAARHWSHARFVPGDAAALPAALGRFDLIVTIGLLQSPGLDARAALRAWLRHHATEAGGLVLGLPNGRFVGGRPVRGARTRNARQTDLSLLVRDLAGHRRYLQQHRYRCRIGGRDELLLAARREA
ncbi:MAG: class I SAM-dependent methyltransferase [Trueperaceae bacterium]